LPPVVRSEEAAQEGVSLSPFVRLRPQAEAAGALIRLVEQYRMHAAIASWPSEAFYDGALIAHPSVAGRALPLPSVPMGSAVTDPGAPVVLVDSGDSGAREVACAARAVFALIRAGAPAGAIGVTAPF